MLPSFHAIVEKVYTSQWFKDVIEKMEPKHLQEDLRQEVIMVLLELPGERLIQMDEDGMLKFYTIRTILNMVKSDRSKFFTMFRNFQGLDSNGDLFEFYENNENTNLVKGYLSKDQVAEDYLEPVEINLNAIFDNSREQLYEKDMLFHYCYSFDRNALAMSRGTGIPYKTVMRTLINAKNKVKCYLQSQQQ